MSGYKKVNYYELCRLCTTTEGTKMHIFREEGRRRQLSSKIQLCLPLQVGEDDSLPKIICCDCVEKLEHFYEFREACVNAEAMLESYFSTIRAEDHKEGQLAAVYVRDPLPAKETKPTKIEILTAGTQVPAPTATALVVPVGADGLSNLIQAAGIQIITDAESARLQPILGTTNAPAVIEASDGTRYAYLNNAVPTPEVSLEKASEPKAEKTSDSSDEGSQHSQHPSQVQSQTITFASAGQEMMVQFNLKEADATNPQLQRASIAQLGEFLKMNLVDGATLVRDPTIPGGLRIVGLPQTILTTQQLQEQQQQQLQQHHHHQQQQQQQQLHQQQQLQQLLHNQSLQQQQELEQQQHQQQELEQQQHQQQELEQQQHQQQQQHHQQQQHLHQQQLQQQQHLHQSNVQHMQLPHKKQNKRGLPKIQDLMPQQSQQTQQEVQHHSQSQQPHEIQEDHKEQHLHEHFITPTLQFSNENGSDNDMSSHIDIDRNSSLCSSIEAVVSGAGGESNETKDSEKFIYSCDDCSKLFKRKEHLFQHQKLHTGERPYVCEHCSKTFIRKEHLLRHSISHAGTKQFECNQCGKNFSRKDNLHKHRKTHSGEGPHICQTCGKSFVVKHYFMMHLACHGAAVESENGEVVYDPHALPFKCDVCGKGFPTKAFRDSHRLRHRKVKKKKDDETNEENLGDPSSQDKEVTEENHHLEEENESITGDIEHLQVEQHQGSQIDQHQGSQEDVQQCHLRELLHRSNVVPLTIQASSNGVNNIIPQILQQMVPTSNSAVIQVQSASNGTTYICSPEILETYRRLQSS